MKDRLEYILQYFKLTSAQFADSIGVQRSSISHIISGRNKPSFDFIQKILLKYPEISAEWLLTGKENPLKPNKTDHPEQNAPVFDNPTDLFTQKSVKEEDTKVNSSLINDIPPIIGGKATTLNTEVTNVNKVKSIVLIYEDDTFKVLSGR